MVFFESEESRRARIETEKRLGIYLFLADGIMRLASGKDKGKYDSQESREREKIAIQTYTQMTAELKEAIVSYESRYARVEQGKSKLTMRITPRKEGCRICGRENVGAYDICAVCLDVYHNQFREQFFKGLDSCSALRIVDGVA